MNKKINLLLLTFILCFSCFGQTISTGYGFYRTNQYQFDNGYQYHFEIEQRLGKHFAFSLALIKGYSNDINTNHDTLTVQQFLLKNINKIGHYHMKSILFKPIFYSDTITKANLFFSPMIGITNLTEEIKYKNKDYNHTFSYTTNSVTYGIEVGYKFPIGKKNNFFMSTSFTALRMSVDRFERVGYSPSFAKSNTFYYSMQMQMSWDLKRIN